MTWVKRVLMTAIGAGAVGTAAAGDGSVRQVGWRPKPAMPPARTVCPPVSVCPPAPSLAYPPPYSQAPSPTPPQAQIPNQPQQPQQHPADASQPTTPQPLPPIAAPGAERPALPSGPNLLAEAPARGTGSGGSLLPNVMGDLLGGGGVAGPLPVYVTPDGQFAGVPPVVVLPTGRTVVTAPPVTQVPVDELLRLRAQQQQTNRIVLIPDPLPVPPPGSQIVGLTPPPGTVFDPSLAPFVARVPQVVRGPFKVTENESPRPTTRAYLSYYFYDDVFQGFGGPNVPRVRVHQQVFGYEQAFLDGRASVGARLPFNQVTSAGGFLNDEALADLTLVTKYAVYDDRVTGNLFSAGLVLTVPTASRPRSTITGDVIGGTLIQPYVGYILRGGPWYVQGFSSFVFPTDDRDATLATNDVQFGYELYRNPDAIVSGVIPTFEVHVNTPLDHRGPRNEPVGFVDQVTLLGGAQFLFRERSAVGFGVGAPVTGPRPFSLQTTVQLNLWF